MRRILMLSTCAALSMSVGSMLASDAKAASTDCNSTLGTPGTIVVLGNIVVPKDAACSIFNATVNGNIDQQSDSVLVLGGNVTVNGNISSHGGQQFGVNGALGPGITFNIKIAGNVEIDSTSQVLICQPFRIDGNLAISNATKSVQIGPWICPGALPTGGSIGGNVSITNNNIISALTMADSAIGNNMSVTNKGSGSKVVSFNTVTGNLECSGNAHIQRHAQQCAENRTTVRSVRGH